MVTKTVEIHNPTGLHARPAAAFIKEVKKYPCGVTLSFRGKTVNARSMVSLMSAGIDCGSSVEIRCDGEQEQAALEALCRAVEDGLGETV